MADFSYLEPEISASFAEETEEYKEQLIRDWTVRCYAWINKARVYIQKEKTVAEKITAASVKTIEDFRQMMKQKRIAKDLLLNQSVLTEGYTLLNEIGEKIRGEEILYSVTVTKTGAAISSGGTGGVITIKVPLQEFLKMVTFTSRRVIMKDSSALYKMIEGQINNDSKSFDYEKWNEQKIASFELYASQVRGLKNYAKINEGNLLEAFTRYIQGGGAVTEADFSNKNYWAGIYYSVFDTLKSPDPFWKGGDIGNEQLKGLNASVTNLNSLINNINEVLNGLKKTQIGADALSPYVKKGFMDKINSEGNQSIEAGQQFLIDFFTSSVERNNLTNRTIDLSSLFS